MPGRAKSETRKSREATAKKEVLIQEAAQLYAKWQQDGSNQGYRAAAIAVEQRNYEQTKVLIKINHRTVRNRYMDLHKSHTEAHYEFTHLTKEQEELVVDYCLELARSGFPLSHRRLRECVDKIKCAEEPDFEGVGENWVDRFIERHWDRLHTYWSSPLDSVRGQAVNPSTLNQFYDIYEAEMERHHFEPDCIYGGDESALLTGVAQSERVIGAKGKKMQWQIREVNRQNTTLMSIICADGTSLPPVIIFKGKHYQVKWNQDNPLNAS
jgi:hypothetical protein